jgi:hypothetical protein
MSKTAIALEVQLDNAEEEIFYLRSVNEKHVKSIINLRLQIVVLENEAKEYTTGDKYHIPVVTCGTSTDPHKVDLDSTDNG